MSITNRLANGVGNIPDADEMMENFDWLTAVARGNFLLAGGFENWGATTSYSDPADETTILQNWTWNKSGTTPPTATVAQETTTVDTGSKALKIDVTGAGSSDSKCSVKQSIGTPARFSGLTVIFAMRVKVATATKVRVSVDDGVSETTGSYHDGDGSWQLVYVKKTMDSSLTEFTVRLNVDPANFTDTVYVDSGFVFVIPSAMSTAAIETLNFFSPDEVVTADVTDLFTYKRPVLKYVSATQVDVENNTGTADETKVIFPDGNVRSVVEDTSSAHKYRRFTITATAEFSSGTEDSGLRSGLSESSGTWYAIYAVKSQIDSSKFVLVGDTTIPSQANVSTLNTRYGSNSWLYLGMIRNGDASGANNDILAFRQNGNMTIFYNSCALGSGGSNGAGIRLTTGTGDITWTYAAGTGNTQVPSHIEVGYILGESVEVGSSGNHTSSMGPASGRVVANGFQVSGGIVAMAAWMNLTENVRVAATADDVNTIALSGYVDGALGVGSNPFI